MSVLRTYAPISAVGAEVVASMVKDWDVDGATPTIIEQQTGSAGATSTNYSGLSEFHHSGLDGNFETHDLVSQLAFGATLAEVYQNLDVGPTRGALIGSSLPVDVWHTGTTVGVAHVEVFVNGHLDLELHIPTATVPAGGTPGVAQLVIVGLWNTAIFWLHKADGSPMPDGAPFWTPTTRPAGTLYPDFGVHAGQLIDGVDQPATVFALPGSDTYSAYDLTGLRLSFAAYNIVPPDDTDFGGTAQSGSGAAFGVFNQFTLVWLERDFVYSSDSGDGSTAPPPPPPFEQLGALAGGPTNPHLHYWRTAP